MGCAVSQEDSEYNKFNLENLLNAVPTAWRDRFARLLLFTLRAKWRFDEAVADKAAETDMQILRVAAARASEQLRADSSTESFDVVYFYDILSKTALFDRDELEAFLSRVGGLHKDDLR